MKLEDLKNLIKDIGRSIDDISNNIAKVSKSDLDLEAMHYIENVGTLKERLIADYQKQLNELVLIQNNYLDLLRNST